MDLNLIRQKLSGLKSVTGKQKALWKPENGEQTIRIVPYQFNADYPFIELNFHYGIAKRSYLSPSTFGRPDPFVEFAEKLKATGDKEDWEMSRKLTPTLRTYVPILVRGKESEGVKFWGFGKGVYTELLEYISDPDYGDITSLDQGRDIKVTYKPKEETGKSYGETSIMIKPNVSPATTDDNVLDKVVNNQKNITEIYREPTYEDLETALKNWLDEDEAEDTNAAAPQANAAPAAAPNTDTVKNAGQAFNTLFDEDKK